MTMETRNIWETVRDTVREGVKEMQEKGESLAHQGRLRLDIFGAQRRLDHLLESLGRIYANRVQEGQSVSPSDAEMSAILVEIRKMETELSTLREELRQAARKPQN
jgi:ubiquinone biosynthesis protein UbiJ